MKHKGNRKPGVMSINCVVLKTITWACECNCSGLKAENLCGVSIVTCIMLPKYDMW